MQRTSHIIVGLSGGVDSAVSAWLLREQGYRVEGLFMKNWEDDDTESHCSAEADYADARQVADALGIPLHRANFAAQYRAEVFDHCLREFRAGRTPNPDILCNQRIKFRAFLDHARRLGADAVATGHYASVGGEPGARTLRRATDTEKDQTYFLYTLGQEQLEAAIFPLAGLTKPAVRRLADQAGFNNFDKPDSTGICFIGERDFRGFLGRYIDSRPGPIATPDGETVGQHEGLAFYTLGQRRGLNLGGDAKRPGLAWYVADKNMETNQLIVVQGHDHPALMSDGLVADHWHWIDGHGPDAPIRCTARLRHRQIDQPGWLTPLTAGRRRLTFDHPQRAVTPGQSVVVYSGACCLGGGIIETRTPVAESPISGVA
ncbi:tRNA 2-thiouridine(34) synthase MnmA [Spiribacter vilamensis]|uniref:tRNA-specific 2-thiouridylase MnmA n=1 Tax=Spiribacter vilamensis TaxID=531306 RepID=A0A4V2GIX0_9GAMM|nr:tRNA 2-thiouridine(34) synthase MnmA [Spiribacter vilamensis]RZU98105.1 tRNA (5-methylaminomethyl-2-thiouridylate)-methyltransferase [Spiribacter vilamensis]TVO60993.1 tRNA 2-thiouridine(34) synthase MnmA [Spiribacter vilamensis]